MKILENVNGERRERGKEMVDIGKMYEDKGLDIEEKEMKEYMKMLIELI